MGPHSFLGHALQEVYPIFFIPMDTCTHILHTHPAYIHTSDFMHGCVASSSFFVCNKRNEFHHSSPILRERAQTHTHTHSLSLSLSREHKHTHKHLFKNSVCMQGLPSQPSPQRHVLPDIELHANVEQQGSPLQEKNNTRDIPSCKMRV